VNVAAAAADSKQAEDLVALDVSGPLPLTDIFLIATGRNERNVVAIASEIEDKMLEAGAKTLRREGRAEGRWILLDFGDVVVHVFHEEDRMYYSLERLWKDCPTVALDVAPATDDPSTEASDEASADETVTERAE
jgi:ribosome-associated protein